MSLKIQRMKGRAAPRHEAPRPRLKRPKLSVKGHTAYGPPPNLDGGAPPMAFPSTPGEGPAMGPPDMAAGGGGPPSMGAGAPEL